MTKGKLAKFNELGGFKNVFQNFTPRSPSLTNYKGEAVNFKDHWNGLFFRNEAPIVLELACGKGEYTIEMAKNFPEKNFFGVDIKGNRIWKGAKHALEINLGNVGFLRTPIEQLGLFLGKDEIEEIWITFPDPFLKERKWKNRLTSINFLEIYTGFLRKDGIVHLKTDSGPLYEFTHNTLAKNGIIPIESYNNINKIRESAPLLKIQTYYEKKHLEDNRTIKYVSFRLNKLHGD